MRRWPYKVMAFWLGEANTRSVSRRTSSRPTKAGVLPTGLPAM
jgi:hypothetical protein